MATTHSPLLSASLIVKDEEDMLPRCLAALQGVVDEIVVLDTGSSDRTIEVAEAAGAIVHRGEWHDDFSRARNEALSHCTGRWVIYVDADEVLQVDDVAAFRKALARSAADAFTVRVDNVEDHGGAIVLTHDPVRLFRRTRFSFEGRIHEHVVSRTQRPIEQSSSDALTITHYGYVPHVVASKDKIERNVRLAEAAWQADPEDALARVELVRALSSTTRHSEALDHLRVLRDQGGSARHFALHQGLKVLLNAEALEESLEWAEEIRDSGTPTVSSARMHGEALFRLGRYDEALAALDGAPADGQDLGVHGTHETETASAVLRGRLLHILGREDEAVDVFLTHAPHAPDSLWPQLIELLHERDELQRAVQPFFDGLDALGEGRAAGVLAALSTDAVELGDAFCEVLAARPEGLPLALAFVTANAEVLTTERAAAWSSVARAAGQEDSCPLLRQMDAFWLPAMQRFMAAAMVVGLADVRGRQALERSAAGLTDEEVVEALYIVGELAPDALMALVTGYVTSQRRALVMADALVGLGGHEQAIAVLHYGLEECAADPDSHATITSALGRLELSP